MGGRGKRNEFLVDGSRLIGPQGSNQCGVLGSGRGPEYEELWREIALSPRYEDYRYEPWADGIEPLEIPRDNFADQLWNDEFASHAHFFRRNGGDVLVMNAFGRKLEGVPWSDQLKRDMLRARTDPRRYHEGEDVKQWLDRMSYEEYLVNVMGLDPGVARYIDPRDGGGDRARMRCALGLCGVPDRPPRDAGRSAGAFPTARSRLRRRAVRRFPEETMRLRVTL